MIAKQKKETLHYFKKNAETWSRNAEAIDCNRVNVIQQRNNYVMKVIDSRSQTRYGLDIGCGSGDLVCEMARAGIDATGIDFADEMIVIAKRRASQQKLVNAHFHCSSLFEYNIQKGQYDILSANGFIEYILPDELNKFLDLAYDAINCGGSLVLGSRNRLFNILSANSFTLEEINNDSINLLLKEAIAIASGMSLDKLAEIEKAPPQQPDIEHESTGIRVSTRYQFTPAQLIALLKERGFITVHLYPIHVHGVLPFFKRQHPRIHTDISIALQNFADENTSLILQSSSFMLHAMKLN